MLRSLVFCWSMSAWWMTAALEAEAQVLVQMYGEAVHEFFDGNYQQAEQRLTQVLDAGMVDPRVYYFRGLARQRLGRQNEAGQDFQAGSQLEAKYGGTEAIGRALTRVQGSDRLQLEEYRTEAQMAVLQKRQRMRSERYGEELPAERGDLGAVPDLEEAPLPEGAVEPDLFDEPADAAPAESGDGPADDLFGEPAEPAEAADEDTDEAADELFDQPAEEGAAEGEEGDESSPPEAEDESDPFGDDPVQPEEEDEEDDPFA
ncbi:MAG: hypothetical protein GTN77_11090 [Planctomycetales bacterium]|nr:hypothetical protein [Planctomycetales bacterium]